MLHSTGANYFARSYDVTREIQRSPNDAIQMLTFSSARLIANAKLTNQIQRKDGFGGLDVAHVSRITVTDRARKVKFCIFFSLYFRHKIEMFQINLMSTTK